MKVTLALLSVMVTIAVNSGQKNMCPAKSGIFDMHTKDFMTHRKSKGLPAYPTGKIKEAIRRNPKVRRELEQHRETFKPKLPVRPSSRLCKTSKVYLWKYKNCWIWGPKIPTVVCKKIKCKGECVPSGYKSYKVPVWCWTKCCGWRYKKIVICAPRRCLCKPC